MVSPASRAVASALVIGLMLVLTPGAMAQQSRDPLMPKSDTLRPWEKRLDRFYSRGNPQQDTNRATKRLYDDPLRKLGEPENKLPGPNTAPGAAPPATLQRGVVELDRDNNGSISREEYFRGRTPFMTPQDRVSNRGRRMMDRLDSQFRNADRNRDGKVTAEELQQGGGRRF